MGKAIKTIFLCRYLHSEAQRRQIQEGLNVIETWNGANSFMVKLKEKGAVTAKIIDLGLAKPATDAPADPAISLPGSFAGTPEFASPEQFAGIGVDIRSGDALQNCPSPAGRPRWSLGKTGRFARFSSRSQLKFELGVPI